MERGTDRHAGVPAVDFTTAGGEAGEVRPERSLGDVVKSIADETVTIVRKEIELARTEVTEAVTARLRAMAALGVAAVAAFFVVLFLGFAAGAALALVMPAWAAWLLVAAVFGVAAGGGAIFAKSRMQSPPLPPEETVKTVRDDIAWAKEHFRQGRKSGDG